MAHACGGELSLLDLVEKDLALGLALQFGDRLVEPLILGAEFGHDVGGELVDEPLLDLLGVLVHRLTTAARLLGLPCHSTMLMRNDGRGVEDPGPYG